MGKCDNCIHEKICVKRGGAYPPWYDLEKDCHQFADKSRFVELPCRVGDTAYWVSRRYGKYAVIPREVDSVECHSNGEWLITSTEDWVGEWLGEIVFLTREEAEAEIERRNGQ